MKLHLVGCSHRSSSVDIRERLAFTPAQTVVALQHLRGDFPGVEAVLLSTCNRVELYLAADEPVELPDHESMIRFLAAFPRLDERDISGHFFQ